MSSFIFIAYDDNNCKFQSNRIQLHLGSEREQFFITKMDSTMDLASPCKSDDIHMVPIAMRDYFFHDNIFEHWWPHFEHIHEKLMKDSIHFWSKVKERQESFLAKPHNPSMMIFPRQWMFPRFLNKEDSSHLFPLDFFHLKQGNDHIFYTKDDESKGEISVDIHDYRPNEIKVHVMGNVLTVEAIHQEDTYLRHFSRKHLLPKGCEAKDVSAKLSVDGILVVTAPKQQHALKGK